MRAHSAVFFFFFKQKTAYEISTRDWSSDVCSSDLGRHEQLDVITGAPASIASNTGRPKPSSNEGYTKATAPAYARESFASVTYPKTFTPGWLSSSGSSLVSRNPGCFLPTIHSSRPGRLRLTSFHASIIRLRFLCGCNEPTHRIYGVALTTCAGVGSSFTPL